MEARARREFEAAESEAALLAARRRRLADVAWEAAQSGRQVSVTVGRRPCELWARRPKQPHPVRTFIARARGHAGAT